VTEAEWLTCADPLTMLKHLRGRASDRKLWLTVCAIHRQNTITVVSRGTLVATKTSYFDAALINVVERFADRKATQNEMDSARVDLRMPTSAWSAAVEAVWKVSEPLANRKAELRVWYEHWERYRDDEDNRTAEAAARASILCEIHGTQTQYLRDLFGNPCRTVRADPLWLAWHDGTVRNLAQAIYTEWAFDRLLILADALEDAGCDNTDILAHCRRPGEHVRGCWVIDLLLGKE
jgi:hypothetical protein